MQFTKFGHACVRLDLEETSIVIDPGSLSDLAAVDGVQHVLITHEHADHFSEDAIRRAVGNNAGLEIWTNSAVAGRLTGIASNVHVVGHGDRFDIDGHEVQVHGEWHAIIHPDIDRMNNVGFLIEDIFHPGDALTVPDTEVDTLFVPAHAPWSKASEVIDYLREVRPHKVYAIHDGLLNDTGLGFLNTLYDNLGVGDYERLVPGTRVHFH